MGWRWPLILSVLAVVAGLYLSGTFSEPSTPPSLGDGWWGRGDREKAPKVDESIRQFSISISNDTINDLKTRLRNTRHFEGLEGTKFHYGVRPEYMQTVVKYWLNKYDFKAQEKYFNKYNHYRTNLEGLDIHFVHVKPTLKPGQKSKPLLISHGWPGSFYECYKILPLLTDPVNNGGTAEDIFEVICPSIPGFGYSEASHKTGMNAHAVARIFGKLMSRLGHDKYYVQGGDWGSLITKIMGLLLPERVKGLHINMMDTFDPPILQLIIGSYFPSLILPAEDHHKVWPVVPMLFGMLRESGYFHIQATKPDTIGHSLTDSPVGLAAYILEKFSSITNMAWLDLEDGGLNDGWQIDDLLNNIMVYWMNGNMASAMRFYKENVGLLLGDINKCQIKVPSGVADFPNEVATFRKPETWVRYKYINLIQYNTMPRGGHFAALEEPQLLAEDIRLFVRKVETLPK
ncbi:epoxide hydrolase 1-like [Amphiura filiformis]|uniref:epoxide hydrolase 1-like n=1 Tax=Amphiura filiformis TaxID=82378 RepID=UPI003B21A694